MFLCVLVGKSSFTHRRRRCWRALVYFLQVKRTLSMAKVDGNTKFKLETILKSSNSAAKLQDLSIQPLSLELLSSMKTELDALAGEDVHPTLNICRVYTAVVGVKYFSLADYRRFCTVMSLGLPLCVQELKVEVDDAEENKQDFDIDSPLMYTLCPSKEDEMCADEPGEDKLEVPALLMDWELGCFYDRACKSFPNWYLGAWANEHVLKTLSTDMEETMKFFKAWREHESTVTFEDDSLGKQAVKSAKQVTLFIDAYMSVCGSNIFDQNSHEAFLSVFVGGRGRPQSTTIKMLASTARKVAGFSAREQLVLKKAPTELEYGAAFKDAETLFSKVAAGTDDDRLTDKYVEDTMNSLPRWIADFRPKCTQMLEDTARSIIISRVNCLMHDDNDETVLAGSGAVVPLEERAPALRTFVKHLKFLKADSLESQTIIAISELLEIAEAKAQSIDQRMALKELEQIAQDMDKRIYLVQPKFMDFLASLSIVSERMDLLEDLAEKLMDVLLEKTAGLVTDEANIVDAKQAAVNLFELNRKIARESCTPTPKYDGELVKTLVERGSAVAQTGSKYLAAATKVNFTAMNKAMNSFKVISISQALPEKLLQLPRVIMTANKEMIQTYGQVIRKKAQEAAQEFRLTLNEQIKIAGGLRDGTNWKDELGDTWTLQQVLAHTQLPKTGLLAGPGGKVMIIKSTLEKATNP
jgi:hypothetical protein